MAVTFTPAAERIARQQSERASRFGHGDLALVATSLFVALAIALAYVGRLNALDRSERSPSDTPINLIAVDRAELIEPGLATAFPNAEDRKFAAEAWWGFLARQRDSRRSPANVGAAARVTVGAEAIERTPRLDVFARRLAAARDAAAAAGRPAPESVPLFTAAELAALKPSFVVRTRTQFRNQVLLWAVAYFFAFHLVGAIWRIRSVGGDRLLLVAAHVVTGIGFAILVSRPDPLRDIPLFVRYSEGIIGGLALMTALSMVDFERAALIDLSYVPLLGAIGLCALLIVFGSGPGRSGAKVNLGPVQPIEAIRLLLAFFLAGYFARRWELLRGVRSHAIRGVRVPAWINVPRGEYVLPVTAGVAVALGLFALQRDLGPALLLCCVFLTMYAIARRGIVMAVVGFMLLIAGFYVGNLMHVSRTLSERVLMWQSPWDNSVPGGDQVAQAIWAMATGGPRGTGAGLGDSRYLPAGHTDLILAAVGEELGVVGWMVLAAAYGAIAWRGFRIARTAPTDYGFFLATGVTLFLIVPALVMAAGVVGAIPLTGVVTPFLSYGGSAMAANFAILGILSSIRADGRPAADLAPFNVPLRWVSGSLAVCALALVAVIGEIQIVHADDYVVRPHLGVQADGGRRYAYNPRLLDVARQIPRGTIFDRRGLPLATDTGAVIARARPEYQKLGISLAEVCPSSTPVGRVVSDSATPVGRVLSDPAITARCYPLGARAFHLLGDATSRMNWGAPNTSYVERDADAALRGFNDHATVISTSDANGRPMSTVRRDYRDIVPFLRHRYERDHPAVVALTRTPHDVRTTIDAALQVRVASILEARARQGSGRAAAVVLDPDSGALLASASYPWPSAEEGAEDTDGQSALQSLLDRARYGLYPPGSTFKLVTAAAALDRDLDLARTTFNCTRLPDGRVGAKLAGWTRVVRDDVLDTHPHGTIDMHGALVQSCNAYFAQLALKLGPQPLVDCAARLGIALAPPGTAAPVARVRDTLPQVGYGQADVLATPLRMARLAGAIAASGTLRDTRWDQAVPATRGAFLTPAAARTLGTYLRDAVTSGTGSSLRNHPWRIAGKTGTAEVSGAPSHAWFVGYAPYGSAKKRIAFAVLIENAGYGGRAAAPVAGEIVTAAAQLGLLE